KHQGCPGKNARSPTTRPAEDAHPMNSTPLVSVILPTYNRAGTLDRAVRSVLSQTFHNFELVIVDDGSTGASRPILEPYSALRRVRVISSPHLGAAAARNLGVMASTAPL